MAQVVFAHFWFLRSHFVYTRKTFDCVQKNQGTSHNTQSYHIPVPCRSRKIVDTCVIMLVCSQEKALRLVSLLFFMYVSEFYILALFNVDLSGCGRHW